MDRCLRPSCRRYPGTSPVTTAELSMTFLDSPPSAIGEITARGRLLYVDGEMGLEVHVRGARDRLVAHGTFPLLRLPADRRIDRVGPPGQSATAGSGPNSPDPHLRTAPVADRGRHQACDGIDWLRAELRGELPPPLSTCSPASGSSAPSGVGSCSRYRHAQDALPAALAVAKRLGRKGAPLAAHAQSAFVDGLGLAMVIAAAAAGLVARSSSGKSGAPAWPKRRRVRRHTHAEAKVTTEPRSRTGRMPSHQ